ncbi:ABC transporter permease subunit [Aquabacterium sp.]|jgi:general L-amino acid transport system permease protein|uniref:ABC transporter permease subunit n=1 Tax=Aquabacterium sp. TaxID=1872578 RepID=UPI0025B855FC|nr:ABC transporter permease subunit [Aquabacterium sp.]
MFEFLQQPAGFDIGETGLLAFDATQPLWRAMLVGLGNTLRVALPALLLATLLATAVALARRARSAPLRWAGGAFVDTLRNVPLLVQLLVVYFLLIEWLPDSSQALPLLPGVWLSKGGLAFPWPDAWLSQPSGQGFWNWPVQGGFNIDGGAALTPEYLAVCLSLTLYTAAFLAEVIRGGLEAVPPSLLEAAETLGATRWQALCRIVLPQALRAIVPAATNQYLNLIKNSSLAVAVGYPDLVSVGNTALNQTGQAVACVLVMMSVYLSLSLLTSAFMNWFNRRQALKGVA